MAKLILLLIFLVGCATTSQKDGVSLSIKMKDHLFSQQRIVERYKNTNDIFLQSVDFDSCLVKWEEEMEKIKKQLLREENPKKRTLLWYRLGNCYNYVGSYKLSFFYYDLALSDNSLQSSKKSVISYNLARVYARKGQVVLAESFYKDSLKDDPTNSLALIELSILYTEQGEYIHALNILQKVVSRFKKSDFVRFLIGVNYFGLGDAESLQSKVIPLINDKSSEARLLLIANYFLRKNKTHEDLLNSLARIETTLPPHRSFRDLLQLRISRSVNDKKEI